MELPQSLDIPVVPPSSPIRILLVDDNPDFLESAARFLATDPRVVVVGRSPSGSAAIEQIAVVHPDLVLMDLAMPGLSGLDTLAQIKAMPAAPRVIILTLYDNPEYREAAQSHDADGFVAKSEFGTELLPLVYSLFA